LDKFPSFLLQLFLSPGVEDEGCFSPRERAVAFPMSTYDFHKASAGFSFSRLRETFASFFFNEQDHSHLTMKLPNDS